MTVNLAKAEKYGLKPGDARWDAATLAAGEEVGDIFRAGRADHVAVWSPERTRHSFTDIETCRSTSARRRDQAGGGGRHGRAAAEPRRHRPAG